MHSFQDLDITTLRKICSRYNLHIKITKYSKLTKDELIPHMEKHLHINSEGKIKIKKEHPEMAETEINKMLHELKNKLKEVKEKVIKHHAKKEIKIDDKKEMKEDKKEMKGKKTVEQMKEEEILKALPFYHKLDDYEGVERNTKTNEMAMMMDHFPTVFDVLQGIEDYLKKHPEADKPKPKKEMKKQVKPATEAQKKEMEDIMKMMKPKMNENDAVEKIEKIEKELKKLEKIITIDEKENKKEHKELQEEITENAVSKMKIKELKELAKKHNIPTTHKVNNKDVAKGAPMLKKELMEKSKIKKGMTRNEIYDIIIDMDDMEREEYLNSATLKEVQIIARFPAYNVKLNHSDGTPKSKKRLIDDIEMQGGQN